MRVFLSIHLSKLHVFELTQIASRNIMNYHACPVNFVAVPPEIGIDALERLFLNKLLSCLSC
ncbi:MAG: hypothetical protein ACI808_002943 [Paraglaciecola sp.]|jgi:hypothetical protein